MATTVAAAIEQPGYALFLSAAFAWAGVRHTPPGARLTSEWLFGAASVCNDPGVREELEFLSEFFLENRG